MDRRPDQIGNVTSAYDYWDSCTAATLYARRRAAHKDTYLTIVAGWDNTPRYEAQNRTSVYQASVWAGFTPELFLRHAKHVLRQAKDFAKTPVVFVNAWNEWNEQAVLEPCTRFGTKVLDAMKLALETFQTFDTVVPNHKELSVIPPETLTKLSVLVYSSGPVATRPISDDEGAVIVPYFEWYEQHDDLVSFHFIQITPDKPFSRDELFHLMRTRKPHLILTIGPFTPDISVMNTLPFAIRRIWVHWNSWENLHPCAVLSAIQSCMYNHHLDKSHPMISVVSTAYVCHAHVL